MITLDIRRCSPSGRCTIAGPYLSALNYVVRMYVHALEACFLHSHSYHEATIRTVPCIAVLDY
jgi:hypothetical protein